MSTAQTWQTISKDPEATLRLAASIGAQLKGGEVIELVSDLGGGKTLFVRGLAQGMGSLDQVSSPSFTLSNQYNAGELSLYHFDFYRLSEAGIMRQELAELITDPQAVIAIEWADIIESVLPEERLTVTMAAIDESERSITFAYPQGLGYLLESVVS